MSGERIVVLGAGSWGTAMALLASRTGHPVRLWARDESAARRMQEERENARYLPGAAFPEILEVTADLKHALEGAELLVSAVPSGATRLMAQEVAELTDHPPAWISATKGLEAPALLRMTEVVTEAIPGLPGVGVLSGPSFAREVADGQPTAVVVASPDLEFARSVQEKLSGPSFRAYASDDTVGVELGGAVKNVIAIAAGLLAGLGYGHDPLAALITRGLREISALAMAQGGRAETMAGLAGLGDLVLTCTGPLSRNRRLGEAIGKGLSLEQALAELGQVAEGASTATKVVALAGRQGIEMPISAAVVSVLVGEKEPEDAIRDLMTRQLKDEFA